MVDCEVLSAKLVNFIDSDNRVIEGIKVVAACKYLDSDHGCYEVEEVLIPSTFPLYQTAKALYLKDDVN